MEFSLKDALDGDLGLSPQQRQLFYTTMKRVVVIIETEYFCPGRPNTKSESSYVCKEDKGVAEDDTRFIIGGGVILDRKGLILTCAHVIPEKSVSIGVRRVDEDLFWQAKIEHMDRKSDLCLLSGVDKDLGIFEFAKFGDKIDVGMEVASICHTEKLVYTLSIGQVAFECGDEDGGEDEHPVAKTPKYRKLGDIIDPVVDVGLTDLDDKLPVIQINNFHGGLGASGAPVFDSRGRVIGITSFILKRFDFAVHLSRCKKFFQDYLRAKRNKERNKKRNKKRKFDSDRKKGGKISKRGHQMDLVP